MDEDNQILDPNDPSSNQSSYAPQQILMPMQQPVMQSGIQTLPNIPQQPQRQYPQQMFGAPPQAPTPMQAPQLQPMPRYQNVPTYAPQGMMASPNGQDQLQYLIRDTANKAVYDQNQAERAAQRRHLSPLQRIMHVAGGLANAYAGAQGGFQNNYVPLTGAGNRAQQIMDRYNGTHNHTGHAVAQGKSPEELAHDMALQNVKSRMDLVKGLTDLAQTYDPNSTPYAQANTAGTNANNAAAFHGQQYDASQAGLNQRTDIANQLANGRYQGQQQAYYGRQNNAYQNEQNRQQRGEQFKQLQAQHIDEFKQRQVLDWHRQLSAEDQAKLQREYQQDTLKQRQQQEDIANRFKSEQLMPGSKDTDASRSYLNQDEYDRYHPNADDSTAGKARLEAIKQSQEAERAAQEAQHPSPLQQFFGGWNHAASPQTQPVGQAANVPMGSLNAPAAQKKQDVLQAMIGKKAPQAPPKPQKVGALNRARVGMAAAIAGGLTGGQQPNVTARDLSGYNPRGAALGADIFDALGSSRAAQAQTPKRKPLTQEVINSLRSHFKDREAARQFAHEQGYEVE